MAEEYEQNVVKELQDEKGLNELNSSEDSQKLHQSQFASQVTKRPLVDCNQESERKFVKRKKYNFEVHRQRILQASNEFIVVICLCGVHKKDLKETGEERRELVKVLKKKEDMLRKLNLVKMYRDKNNLSDLEDLINKWRSISQTAAQDLFDRLNKDKVITMGQFLDGMRIGHDLVKYSDEDETFY